MHPIIPILMSLGAILFLSGIGVYAVLGLQRVNMVRIFGKDHQLWQFVVASVGSGIVLIVLSALLQKHIFHDPVAASKLLKIESPNSLKYELNSTLSNLKINTPDITTAIFRFQAEYLIALQNKDEKTMGLLSLELSYRLKTALAGQRYSEKQIDHEVEQIMSFLKENQPKK
ncbi:MAG: hypothetical protein LM517_03135 [Nitrosomonas sp.]|nr:hypothetical protein [Nitrosomonas sp.]